MHLDFDQISEIADGRAPAEGDARHLADCAACRETLRRVQDLVAAAHALPRDVAPPPEVWASLRERVAGRPESRRFARVWWRIGSIAAAAVFVLVIGTALLLHPAAKAKGAKLSPPAPAAIPLVVASVDRNYSETLTELRTTLDSQRATLSPTTVRTVERSLAVIDSAIAEAHAALARDPANQTLVDILAAHYERKVDLLQRASELSSSN